MKRLLVFAVALGLGLSATTAGVLASLRQSELPLEWAGPSVVEAETPAPVRLAGR